MNERLGLRAMTDDTDNLEGLTGPELHARAMRDRLKEKALNLVDRYCDEAEHNDGHSYWNHFETIEQAVDDFVLWAKYLQDNED